MQPAPRKLHKCPLQSFEFIFTVQKSFLMIDQQIVMAGGDDVIVEHAG